MDGNNIETKNRRPGNGPRVYCQFLVFQDWANTMTAVTVEPKHVLVTLAEAQEARAVVMALVMRRTPVVTVPTPAVERTIEATASRGKEDAVTIGACYLTTVLAILSRPGPGAVVY